MSKFINDAEAERSITRMEEVESEKESKRLEREQRKLERELKKKREFQEKLVAPVILVFSIIASLVFLALR